MADTEPVEFTRGSLGAADTRGLSLVERHAEARARALEEETLARLHSIFGLQVPLSVLALAVSVAASSSGGSYAREAEALVREFLADKGKELEKLFRRDDGGDGDGAKKKKKPSRSSSSDDDDDDDESDSDRDRKGRRRSSKRKSSKKESKKRSKRSKKNKKDDKKSEKKKRRRGSDSDGSDNESDGGGNEKRAKAPSRPAAAAATTAAALASQYGSHGLLRAENPRDAELKRSEFFAWCSEVKKVASMEALAMWEETELWRTFVEDFNTATFPSDKYYDLMAWQQRKAGEEAKKRKGKEGEEAPSISAADDEAARRAEAKRRREEEAAERLKEAYNALKYSDAGKKEDMKRQELLKIELRVAARTGDTEKVARLQKLLAPDPK